MAELRAAGDRQIVGVAAFSRTVACVRFAKDADKAPTITDRITLMHMSAQAVESYDRVAVLCAEHGFNAPEEGEQFIGVLGDFDERTRPLDWPERVLKTSLGLGLLTDFAMGLVDGLEDPLRAALMSELADSRLSQFTYDALMPLISHDVSLAQRLGLWGRRVVGEEIGTLQRLLVTCPTLISPDTDIEVVHAVLTQGATRRMQALGLNA
ncbi:ferritin-like fold-containing protein [Actinomyces vulturis]|uniref:ferritin-like fold-containing protein n=1 Tax=Actinomyces vulturis TaxID=1857645 RepID=UPI00083152DC|nr:ferritin-like fold-containing protein [Actinomyces vulturis]